MVDPDIDAWLRKAAASIDLPLKRRKLKKRHSDVRLGLEIYASRSGTGVYVEFTIYSDDVPRPGPFESPSIPLFTWRLKNRSIRRTGGDHPDMVLTSEDSDLLARAREEMVVQGNEIFGHVNSLTSLVTVLRGGCCPSLLEPGEETGAALIADKVEDHLRSRSVQP